MGLTQRLICVNKTVVKHLLVVVVAGNRKRNCISKSIIFFAATEFNVMRAIAFKKNSHVMHL